MRRRGSLFTLTLSLRGIICELPESGILEYGTEDCFEVGKVFKDAVTDFLGLFIPSASSTLRSASSRPAHAVLATSSSWSTDFVQRYILLLGGHVSLSYTEYAFFISILPMLADICLAQFLSYFLYSTS